MDKEDFKQNEGILEVEENEEDLKDDELMECRFMLNMHKYDALVDYAEEAGQTIEEVMQGLVDDYIYRNKIWIL